MSGVSRLLDVAGTDGRSSTMNCGSSRPTAESQDHSLQPTRLVDEGYLRLVGLADTVIVALSGAWRSVWSARGSSAGA
jgi:hypothetical protein